MAKLLLFFICLILFTSCDDCNDKYLPMAIEKTGDFIHVGLIISPISKDSIITKVTFTNNSSKAYVLYKPLLPYQDFTEEIFGLLEKTNLTKVNFFERRQEHYLQDGHCSLISYNVIPVITNENLIYLQPKGTLTVACNIARKYDFDSYLSKGLNEFVISYAIFNPSIVNGKQEVAVDTVSKSYKPVYYVICYGKLFHIDSMQVSFKIP